MKVPNQVRVYALMSRFIHQGKTPYQFERELANYNILPFPKNKYISKSFAKIYAEQENKLKKRFINEYRLEFVRQSSKKTRD